MEEKRQFPRVSVNAHIGFKDNLTAIIKDISENGIRIMFTKSLLKEEHILLFIPLFEDEKIHLEAKVIWCKESADNVFEHGLQIVSISDRDRKKLRGYIDEKLLQQNNYDEKRKCRRADLNIVVNYAIKANAVTKNINKNGLCIVTDEMLPVDVIIMLIIFLPEKVSIKAYGKVAWSKEVDAGVFESGIEFWEIRRSDKEDLEKYIEKTFQESKKR